MNHTKAAESDASSTNGDVIDMDVGENAAMMSDSEVNLELQGIYAGKPREVQSNLSTAGIKILGDTPLATPKILSAVVIPESSGFHRPNIGMRSSSAELKSKPEKSKRNRNRNGSVKNKTGKLDGPLVSLMSKVTMSNSRKDSRAVDAPININGLTTPATVKRARSAVTTPESGTKQPDKLAKLYTKSPVSLEGTKSRNLLERRTLNLKVSLSQRPPTGNELQAIKQFLHYQIEQALEHRADFIPIFSAPCKIGQDGVYVYCDDQTCANWITYIAKTGIPGISGALVVVPQETPMKFDPALVRVRVFSKIPTKQPKDKILANLAQMNRDINTESWLIKRIRPMGSNSVVYMRIDMKSFETITKRGGSVNWILGPIDIRKEEHKSRGKTQTPGAVQSVETKNSKFRDNHVKPPSDRSVDTTPRGTGLTKNGGSEPEGLNWLSHTAKKDGPATPKEKLKVA